MVKKKGSTLDIEVDVNRIVAISTIMTMKEGEDVYYIYFENACWQVLADSYETVLKAWKE